MKTKEFFEQTVRSYKGAKEARYRINSLTEMIADRKAEVSDLEREKAELEQALKAGKG